MLQIFEGNQLAQGMKDKGLIKQGCAISMLKKQTVEFLSRLAFTAYVGSMIWKNKETVAFVFDV